jgi:hypothetical protein
MPRFRRLGRAGDATRSIDRGSPIFRSPHIDSCKQQADEVEDGQTYGRDPWCAAWLHFLSSCACGTPSPNEKLRSRSSVPTPGKLIVRAASELIRSSRRSGRGTERKRCRIVGSARLDKPPETSAVDLWSAAFFMAASPPVRTPAFKQESARRPIPAGTSRCSLSCAGKAQRHPVTPVEET